MHDVYNTPHHDVAFHCVMAALSACYITSCHKYPQINIFVSEPVPLMSGGNECGDQA
jgi:hypothetical protein